MRVGRADHPELVWIRTELGLELQASFCSAVRAYWYRSIGFSFATLDVQG